MTESLHVNILPKEQKKLFDFLSSQQWLSKFYLAGGTSLALRIGHRESVDFDFFTLDDFDTKQLIDILSGLGKFELLIEDKNTLYAMLNEVKISFFKYKYPLLKPVFKHRYFQIADVFDVGLMKLEAISGRGAKKDFIDLFFILKQFSLLELLLNYEDKYGVAINNHYHLMKSLLYFEDADKERTPVMFQKVKWEEVKKAITIEVKKLAQKF